VCDRLYPDTDALILDLGCGQGFLANSLYDWGFRHYIGVDFCPEVLVRAKETVPSFTFLNHDLREPGWELLDYDVVVSTEFVEHVHDDTWILSRIRPGTRTIVTSTNVLSRGHVRAFSSKQDMVKRYASLFDDISVVSILGRHYEDLGWQVYYLLEGVKR